MSPDYYLKYSPRARSVETKPTSLVAYLSEKDDSINPPTIKEKYSFKLCY